MVSLCVVQGHSRLLEEVGLTQAPQARFYSSGILILLILEGEFSALGVRYIYIYILVVRAPLAARGLSLAVAGGGCPSSGARGSGGSALSHCSAL